MAGPFVNREIVLGVTGSIAAYKACELASRLKEGKAHVTAALSDSALKFVGAASFEAITGGHVITDMFESPRTPDIEHIAMAKRAHLYLIAPATANIIAKAAHGIADDWLSTTLLATRAPILFAPAMNTQMYTHPATQENIRILRERGCHFVGPGEGMLACGDVGPGRLIEPEAILEAAAILLSPMDDLAGKRVLITSGPNHEPIDPVRYIANRSSGKMGRALALEALYRGAEVTVVSGPASTPLPYAAEVVRVETAQEMLEAVEARWDDTDIFVAAAAVADYRVEEPAPEKHKRGDGELELRLLPNPDIAARMGERKRPGPICVGFAAETHDFVENAQAKLAKKHLDIIVANKVGSDACAFASDSAMAWILSAAGPPEELELLPKAELAQRLFDKVSALL